MYRENPSMHGPLARSIRLYSRAMGCRRLMVWATTYCLMASITASALAQDKTKTAQTADAVSSQNQAATPAPAPAAKPPDVTKEALVFDKLYTQIREESDG